MSNARFTFSATATLTSRHVLSTIFALDSIGTIVYYYHPDSGADFADPASFAAGTPIVTATIRAQNILSVQGPNKGIATNIGEFTQTGAASFTLDGQVYQLGRTGLLERSWATGEGTRTDPITPKSFTFVPAIRSSPACRGRDRSCRSLFTSHSVLGAGRQSFYVCGSISRQRLKGLYRPELGRLCRGTFVVRTRE